MKMTPKELGVGGKNQDEQAGRSEGREPFGRIARGTVLTEEHRMMAATTDPQNTTDSRNLLSHRIKKGDKPKAFCWGRWPQSSERTLCMIR